ncbi:hypothetical protein NPIL_292781 [Nephila pilipes]|uniref:Uncharacterized protein n=1 Tax=Nephila pilipes TaxID=299642 RepID=A0A8X6IF03_NEPPI|nr:hypothetical protein NPIL_292781 [Nephila pilipes]
MCDTSCGVAIQLADLIHKTAKRESIYFPPPSMKGNFISRKLHSASGDRTPHYPSQGQPMQRKVSSLGKPSVIEEVTTVLLPGKLPLAFEGGNAATK